MVNTIFSSLIYDSQGNVPFKPCTNLTRFLIRVKCEKKTFLLKIAKMLNNIKSLYVSSLN